MPGRTHAPRTIRIPVSLAGARLSRSSSLAAQRPKYMYLSFLYPTMESMVLTALYSIPPAGPRKAMNKKGAMTPSEAFSATVSTAALAIPPSSSAAVSLPTIMDTLYLASSVRPSSRLRHTFMLSVYSPLAASMRLHRNPSAGRSNAQARSRHSCSAQ